jgi:hypothetical protein
VKLASELVFVVNTQQEFWAREFGAKIIEKDESFISVVRDLVSQKIRPIVQLDKDFAELETLASLPENSIIGWCHSDETFDSAFNSAIAEIKSLHIILRPYHLEESKISNSVKSLSYTFSNLHMSRSLGDVIRTIAWQFRGFGMQARQKRILHKYRKADKNFRNIPIGYTNVFALSLLEVLEKNIKIMGSLLNLELNVLNKSQRRVNFVGQSGQIVRESAIRSLEKSDLGQVVRRSGYGASNVIDLSVSTLGKEYIELLLDSQFVLCPPGNISGQSFRYFEVITLGRIPLVMNHVTSDPNFNSGYVCGDLLPSTGSWTKMLDASQKIDLAGVISLVKINTEAAKSEVHDLREYLLDAVSNFRQEHN